MLADHYDVAIVQVVATHALGFHVDAVCAVQIFNHARVQRRDYLTMVSTHEPAIYLQVVVRRTPYDDAPDTEHALLDGASVSCNQQPTVNRVAIVAGYGPSRRVRFGE